MTDLGIRFAMGQVQQVTDGGEGVFQKSRESSGVAADEAPDDAEQQQGKNGIAAQDMYSHPVQLGTQPGYEDQHHEGPMEDASRQVPDTHRQIELAHSLVIP